jgi:hypothetical protein
MKRLIIGAVLKYNDDLLPSNSSTVLEHNKVVREKGMAWLGKFGTPVRSAALKWATTEGIELKLILVRSRQTEGPRIFMAPVVAAQNRRPDSALVPAYYRNKLGIYSWFCINGTFKALTPQELKGWVIASSGMPLAESTKRSSRPFFWAAQKTSAQKVGEMILELGRLVKTGPDVRRRMGRAFAEDNAADDVGDRGDYFPSSWETD